MLVIAPGTIAPLIESVEKERERYMEHVLDTSSLLVSREVCLYDDWRYRYCYQYVIYWRILGI